mgnify:FL=1
MEKGTIDDGRGIAAWTPENQREPLCFPVWKGKSIIIAEQYGGPILGSQIVAYLCRKCKKIVIDISNKI